MPSPPAATIHGGCRCGGGHQLCGEGNLAEGVSRVIPLFGRKVLSPGGCHGPNSKHEPLCFGWRQFIGTELKRM
jgi:hypothetical protein